MNLNAQKLQIRNPQLKDTLHKHRDLKNGTSSAMKRTSQATNRVPIPSESARQSFYYRVDPPAYALDTRNKKSGEVDVIAASVCTRTRTTLGERIYENKEFAIFHTSFIWPNAAIFVLVICERMPSIHMITHGGCVGTASTETCICGCSSLASDPR